MVNERFQEPLVSVIIPAYNAAGFIGETLTSVFNQTYSNYEVIVVNDGSPDTDELEKVLAPFRDRLIYLEQENKGPSAARNNAIGVARGEFVAFLDSDDTWLPNYLEEQIKLICSERGFDMVYSDALLFGDSPLSGRRFMECAPSVGPVTFESLLLYQTSVITSGTVVRRQAVIDAGLFDERFIRCEDFDLWIRLAHRGARIGFQEQVLARHRAHGASLAANEIAMVESQIEILKKAKQTLKLSDAQQELIDRQLQNCAAQIDLAQGKRYFAAGDYQQAARALERANSFNQSLKLKLVILLLDRAPGLLHFLYKRRRSSALV
jgi:glycosyltransferase involved in cell wall biosynthesis